MESIKRILLSLTCLVLTITSAKAQEHILYYFPNADEEHIQGFLRITNVDYADAFVEIVGIDDDGSLSSGNITFTLAPLESIHLNSQDIEWGNKDKGANGALGDGQGDWRIVIKSNAELQAMNYIRTSDGFLNDMHDVVGQVPSMADYAVPIFNPASNTNQISKLRISNDSDNINHVLIMAADDEGTRGKRPLTLTLNPYQTAEISAQELEAGLDRYQSHGYAGNGTGKWKLMVTATDVITVVNLLQAGNYISNLSGMSYDINQTDAVNTDDFYTNSAVAGVFTGWHGNTTITLQDGTRWKQDEPYEGNQISNITPFATYVEMSDGWFLWVKGTEYMVKVRKL